VTLSPAQTSGNFRLALLSTIEQSCMTGINSGRAAASLGSLVPDENGFEFERAFIAEQTAQNTDTPTPLFGVGYFYNVIGYQGAAAGSGFTSCPEYTNTYTFNPASVPYGDATNPSALWYAADWNGASYTGQIFLGDPR
jgi:hypothetical protein